MSAAAEYKPVHGGYPGAVPEGRWVVVYDNGEPTIVDLPPSLVGKCRLGVPRGMCCEAFVFNTPEDAQTYADWRNNPESTYYVEDEVLQVRKL